VISDVCGARQRHRVVLHFDADLLGMHGRLPFEFGHHVLLPLRIGLPGVDSKQGRAVLSIFPAGGMVCTHAIAEHAFFAASRSYSVRWRTVWRASGR